MGVFSITGGKVTYGMLFILGGAVKTRAFGRAFASILFGHMSEAFEAAHYAFSMEDKISAVHFQEIVGCVEMMCGFMLLTNQLVTLGATVLMGITLGAVYTLNVLEQTLLMQGTTFMIFWGLLMLVLNMHQEKPRRD